jgi:hypothetical protein
MHQKQEYKRLYKAAARKGRDEGAQRVPKKRGLICARGIARRGKIALLPQDHNYARNDHCVFHA